MKLGEPIPLGIVTTDTAVLGEKQATEPTPAADANERESVNDEVLALKQEIEAHKSRIADAGRITVQTVEAHPLIAATIISLGIWGLMAMRIDVRVIRPLTCTP
ncbi:hypothetical protein [Pararhizobium sp. PWRC1-1]|uniref:hypothetical protein n=1 Tax=Pararhizobium sp. PWRC1-1 TaxID=2804566 RepID=UPI003CF1025A